MTTICTCQSLRKADGSYCPACTARMQAETRRENRAIRANEYGYEAGVEGERRENPYGEDCAEFKAWEAGFEQGAQVRREA